ncbi:hypothetical protein BaRGS_00024230 [Batillaria attramentaria]|uniref:Sushi domain-containing protein n=1 Tax=Batillaria attramentaria TaxID=370345 RepID=A0ABD0KBK1_9CAEN
MIIPRLLEQCLLVILLFAFRSSSNTFHPFSRLDVMGNYTVVNIHQCGRLCWYRQLCDFYSFNQNTSTAGAEINCVLHTGQNYATERKDGWVQRPATGTDVTNGCATRPCSQTEVCVPAPSNYQCLPVPSRCKQPGNVTDADVIVTGTSQDDVAIVRCREGLSVIPHNAVTELRCQVTSQWTTFDGTCVKAEYLFDPPENKFVGSLPSMIAPNWVMCVKGVFTDEGQLYLNLQPDVDNSHDVTFHFALKLVLLWNTLVCFYICSGTRNYGLEHVTMLWST